MREREALRSAEEAIRLNDEFLAFEFARLRNKR